MWTYLVEKVLHYTSFFMLSNNSFCKSKSNYSCQECNQFFILDKQI